MTELALRRRRDRAAQRMGHQLHAVTDPEHRYVEIEQSSVALRRAGIRNALRSAGEDDACGFAFGDFLGRRVGRPYFGVDRQLPQAPSDQLRVLRAEIQNDDGLVGHGA